MRTYKVLDWGCKESLALYLFIYNEGALVPGMYMFKILRIPDIK